MSKPVEHQPHVPAHAKAPHPEHTLDHSLEAEHVPAPAPTARRSRLGEAWGRFRYWLTLDTSGGVLLAAATIAALIAANSPLRGWYEALAHIEVGPEAVDLHMSVATWASDGLLAVFFLVIGLELKHELTHGSLRNPREAAVPIIASVGGVALPAAIFALIIATAGHGYGLAGWAIPSATDTAFALALLAVFGRGLARGVRPFLLTLAVIDDILAILIIAIFYSHGMHWPLLAAGALVVLAIWRYAASRRPMRWVLIALCLLAWAFFHASGLHATLAGVLIGLVVPANTIFGEHEPRTEQWSHTLVPWSQGLALPLFAFFAAGINIGGAAGLAAAGRDPVVYAVVAALIAGKFVGILGTTAIVTRFTKMRLADGMTLRDLVPVGFLAGIGFTVALLVTELAYGRTGSLSADASLAILIGSGISAILAAISMRRRSRIHAKPTLDPELHVPVYE